MLLLAEKIVTELHQYCLRRGKKRICEVYAKTYPEGDYSSEIYLDQIYVFVFVNTSILILLEEKNHIRFS